MIHKLSDSLTDIMDSLHALDKPLTEAELIADTGIPRGSVTNALRTGVNKGLVVKTGRLYTLSASGRMHLAHIEHFGAPTSTKDLSVAVPNTLYAALRLRAMDDPDSGNIAAYMRKLVIQDLLDAPPRRPESERAWAQAWEAWVAQAPWRT